MTKLRQYLVLFFIKRKKEKKRSERRRDWRIDDLKEGESYGNEI